MATSISSSEVVTDIAQADGRRYVRYSFVAVDHAAGQEVVFVGPKLVASGFNTATDIVAAEPGVLEYLAVSEVEGALDTNLVANPYTYTLSLRWTIARRVEKKLARYMMNNRDPRFVVYMEPMVTHWKATYTNTALSTRLELALPKILQMYRRTDAILLDTGTVNTLLVDFDAEEEDLG